MIGEVQRLLDEGIDVDALPLAAATARMREHALDDIVGPLAMLRDAFEIAGQCFNNLLGLGALIRIQDRNGRVDRGLQFVQQLDRNFRKIVDEIERVLDLVGDAGRELAERGHLLGMDQIGLRRL